MNVFKHQKQITILDLLIILNAYKSATSYIIKLKKIENI